MYFLTAGIPKAPKMLDVLALSTAILEEQREKKYLSQERNSEGDAVGKKE